MKKYLPFLVAGVWTAGLLIGLSIPRPEHEDFGPSPVFYDLNWYFPPPPHTVYVDRKVYVIWPEMMPDAWVSDRPCSFQKFLDGHVTVDGCTPD